MRDPVQIAAIALAVGLIIASFWLGAGPSEPPAPESLPRAEAPLAPPPPPAPGEVRPPAATVPEPARAERIDPGEPAESPVPTQAESVMLENDAVRLLVSSAGARVQSIQLLQYPDRIGEDSRPVELVTTGNAGTLVLYLGEGPLAGLESRPHRLLEASERSASYEIETDGVQVRRTLTLDETGYGGELRVSVQNQGTQSVQPRYELAFYGRERASDAPDHFQNYQLVASADGELERNLVQGIGSPGFFGRLLGSSNGSQGAAIAAPVEWGGVESQYFLLAALPENPRETTAYQGPIGRDTGQLVVRYPAFEVPRGREIERVYRLYFGPKVVEEVAAVDPRLEPAVHVGWTWVRPIVDVFAWMLRWCYDNVVANYGVAIILLTIMLRVGTYPLTQKSMRSMKRFGEIAPLMKELQEKYKDDKQKLSEEMMGLYRQKGINPISAMGGGCLPMLIQMPFMIALYFALQSSIELRHAPFILWINDLSAPENIPIFGLPFRPLPLLMGASMLLQQKLAPQTGDPQQRRMMMWMSVIFTFMFYQFPSGLLLYWFVSNLLGIAQQFLVNRGQKKTAAA